MTIAKNKRILILLSIVSVILLIPFVAMQFTNEVDWNLADFIVAGGLLLGTGLLIEALSRKISNPITRMALALGLLLMLIYIWVELAVGIFFNS